MTVGPTATPNHYTVQEGDTLLEIALRFGVTVEAILAVNPDVQPRTLQPGAQLLIPLPDVEPTPGILPTPTPLPLGIAAIACIAASSGGQVCFTEVSNVSPEAVTGVAVEIVLTSQDEPTAGVGYLPAPILRAGQTAPIAVRFANEYTVDQSAAGSIIAAEAAGGLESNFIDLVVVRAEFDSTTAPAFVVRGELANESSSIAAESEVVVTLYAADGAVRGYRQVEVGAVEAGGSAPFMVEFTTPASHVVDFAVIAQGRLVD